MDKIQIIFMTLGILGCILLILGYLIKFQNKIQLIAGVYKNEDIIKDKEAFASFVGGNVLILGVIFCVGALGIYIHPGYKELIEPVLLLSVLAIGIILFAKRKTYIKRDIEKKER
jgi:drug/metabolite transporter (DMT)-like permease